LSQSIAKLHLNQTQKAKIVAPESSIFTIQPSESHAVILRLHVLRFSEPQESFAELVRGR
jgi:hypothetical protein